MSFHSPAHTVAHLQEESTSVVLGVVVLLLDGQTSAGASWARDLRVTCVTASSAVERHRLTKRRGRRARTRLASRRHRAGQDHVETNAATNAYFSTNSGDLSKRFPSQKLNRDQSSVMLFCKGVPVNSKRDMA